MGDKSFTGHAWEKNLVEILVVHIWGLQLLLDKGKRRHGAYSLRRLNNNAEKTYPANERGEALVGQLSAQ
jgi:hypothetical protein